mgnify:FL=1
MKKVLSIVFLVAAMLFAANANAQIKFGLKGGLNVTNMTFTKDIFDASNKTGFFIGPMVKVSLPLGFSVDAAALYDQKSADVKYDYTEVMYVDKTTDGSFLLSPSVDVVYQKSSGVAKVKQQSINVPVNLRYAVGLGSMANMFFFAGPQWGFNIGHKNYDTSFSNGQEGHNFFSFKNSNFSINVGLGATLLKHLQVSANYNIACGKTADISYGKVLESIAKARSRSNCWQIALGYWF